MKQLCSKKIMSTILNGTILKAEGERNLSLRIEKDQVGRSDEYYLFNLILKNAAISKLFQYFALT